MSLLGAEKRHELALERIMEMRLVPEPSLKQVDEAWMSSIGRGWEEKQSLRFESNWGHPSDRPSSSVKPQRIEHPPVDASVVDLLRQLPYDDYVKSKYWETLRNLHIHPRA